MSNNVPYKRLLLTTAMGFVAMNAVPAHAVLMATTPQTQTFEFLNKNVYDGLPYAPSPTPLTFNKFDPTLGTLTDVKIELVSKVFGDLNVFASGINGGVPQGEGGATADLDVDLDVDVETISGHVFGFHEQFNTECDFNHVDDNGTCSNTENFDEDFLGEYHVDNDGGILANFIKNGTSTFDITLSALATVSCQKIPTYTNSCYPDANFNWANNSPGEVTVTYTYEEAASVPEPATLGLISAGLAGLGLSRRRRVDPSRSGRFRS